MNILCLGGAGRICREAILDLVQYSKFERITVADVNEEEGHKVVEWLNDARVDFRRVDVTDRASAVAIMREYDIVMDGTTIKLNGVSTACIAEAGCHSINLNGFGEEDVSGAVFERNGKVCVPGFGMTPGVTQMMAMHAANLFDEVREVRVSHGSYRPIAFSRSIVETTVYEYDPELPGRVVYENGEFVQVPPFARPREVRLPEPYGTQVQYIIPHAETRTLARALADKGVRLIEVRGTWPQANMRLVRALYDFGFLRNDKIAVGGQEIGILDCIAEYLFHSKEGRETELYGYALHVEMTGTKDGQAIRRTLTHTHPASDGSVPGWEKLRAYTRNVGIPFAIGAELIASGRLLDPSRTGILIPEEAFRPEDIFRELKRRGIEILEEVEQLGGI